MSGSAQGHNALLPSLWDDANAAGARRAGAAALPLQHSRRRSARHQFRRRQHLRQGRREGPADRRRRRSAVGQGLRRRSRLDEARRLRDALSRQAARPGTRLSRPRTRGRDGGACSTIAPSTSTPARPRSTRRCTASCRTKHVDHVHADAVIAIAASENAEALTQQVFGGKLGFLPWQRPGFDLGLKLGAMARDNPQLDGVVLGGHGLFTWGADRQSNVTRRPSPPSTRRSRGWRRTQGAGVRRRRGRGAAAEQAARGRRAADAGDPRPHLRGRAQGRPFHRRARSAGVRQLPRSAAARRARHLMPRSFPAHKDPPARRSSHRRRRRGARRRARRLPRRLRRLLRALQTPDFAGDARSQRGRLSRSRRSA